MIQITPQMRILVAVEPADFRKGIDGLARVCKDVLRHDPFGGCVFVFRNRPATALKVLVYDGQGFWLCHKRLSSGRFRWWPKSCNRGGQNAGRPSVARLVLGRRSRSDPGGAGVAGRHSCRLTRTPGGNRAVNRADCSSRFRRRRVMVRPRAGALKKCEPLPSGLFFSMLYAASGGRALSIHMIPSKSAIVELDMGELEEILRRVEAKQLQADDYQTIRELIESYVGLTLAVGDKSTTIRRLRQMLFGATTEKTATVVGATTRS